ncbi:hypothetical protein HK102_011131 [Quaeritorhiza haematococci]|nr:hypothetical protein HK102_011131 [Quaeritorhiza haematococci]
MSNTTTTPTTEKTREAAATTSNKYNKYVLGAASLGSFAAMVYTIRQRTKGRMRVPLQELLENPTLAAQNPKLTAYMYAGRAFMTATFLTVTGTLALGMGIASVMGVNNLKEFSQTARSWSTSQFPQLNASAGVSQGEDGERFDEPTREFLQEIDAELAKGPTEEGPGYRFIKARVARELGPLARG